MVDIRAELGRKELMVVSKSIYAHLPQSFLPRAAAPCRPSCANPQQVALHELETQPRGDH
jgi:hypothetical protein